MLQLNFADAARSDEHDELGYSFAMVTGHLYLICTLHFIERYSPFSKQLANSMVFAGIIACENPTNMGLRCMNAFCKLLRTDTNLSMCANGKRLFRPLKISYTATDESILADICLICYYYDTTKQQQTIWIRGSIHEACSLTKEDGRAFEVMYIMLHGHDAMQLWECTFSRKPKDK